LGREGHLLGHAQGRGVQKREHPAHTLGLARRITTRTFAFREAFSAAMTSSTRAWLSALRRRS
jgi:hypothetical protein